VSHLGRWLSALVDGELEGEERDRVLNHVAGCSGCRQEANAMRALKRRLTALGDHSAEPAIAGRLMELAWTSRADNDDFADTGTGAGPAAANHALRPGVRLLAASAGSALAAVGMMAFLLGSRGSPPAPKVTPSVVSYLMQHAYDAGQAPAGSAPVTTPASGYRHGARLAGPALARPEQFGSGLVTDFAATGAVGGTGAAHHSLVPMVSHRPG